MNLLGRICSLLFISLAFLMLADLLIKGGREFHLWYFFEPVLDLGRTGGIGPVLVSTGIVTVIGVLVALPFGLGGGILISEILGQRPRLAWSCRRSLDVMIAVPSVAVGLAGKELFCHHLGLGYSLIAGGLTLAVMLVPIMIAAFAAGFDGVSIKLREQCSALGMTRWQTLWKEVIPAARPALIAGVALALGRATAETAALLLTSGVSTRMPENLFDPGATLGVFVYHLSTNGMGGQLRPYTAALTLVMINAAVHLVLMKLTKWNETTAAVQNASEESLSHASN